MIGLTIELGLQVFCPTDPNRNYVARCGGFDWT